MGLRSSLMNDTYRIATTRVDTLVSVKAVISTVGRISNGWNILMAPIMNVSVSLRYFASKLGHDPLKRGCIFRRTAEYSADRLSVTAFKDKSRLIVGSQEGCANAWELGSTGH
jgi:hypothetical protein